MLIELLIWRRVLVQIVHQVQDPDGCQDFVEQAVSSSFEYSASAWSTEVGGSGNSSLLSSTSQGDAYVVYSFQVGRC